MSFALLALVLAGCGAKTGLGAGERPGTDAGREPWTPPDAHRTLSMAWSHACVIDGGDVLCWGDNSLGLVADGAPLQASPTRVEGLPVIVEVATGQLVSCALDGEGVVWCWGTSTGSESGRRRHDDSTGTAGGAAVVTRMCAARLGMGFDVRSGGGLSTLSSRNH